MRRRGVDTPSNGNVDPLSQPGSAVDHLLHRWAVALADDLDARGGGVELRQLIRRAG